MESMACPAASATLGHLPFPFPSNCTIFTASVIASVVILLSYLTFKIGHRLQEWALYLFTVSFEINGPMNACGSDLYCYTVGWLHENVPGWTHHQVTAHSVQDEVGRTTTEFKKPPGFETPHYFNYGGAWIQVSRKQLGTIGIVCDHTPYESVTFRTLRSNGGVLKKILDEIHTSFRVVEPDETRTHFYYACDGTYWREFGNAKRKRPLNSVILNETTLTSLVSDVREFLDSEEWYRNRGIPYRRGYLLYGPPGNGKSSFVKAIAGEFGYNICILSLSSSKNMNDDSLNELMNSTPENSIILLEDIDAAFPSRDVEEDEEEKKKKDLRSPEGEASSGKVTLRGLLNSLDGVASTEGRIVFLTTNYVNRLDSAMTRPGRVDMKVSIALPNDVQINRMFARFYPETNEAEREEFVRVIRALPKPVSMAMIQGLFMLHKHSHVEVTASAPTYFDEQFFSLKASVLDE